MSKCDHEWCCDTGIECWKCGETRNEIDLEYLENRVRELEENQRALSIFAQKVRKVIGDDYYYELQDNAVKEAASDE